MNPTVTVRRHGEHRRTHPREPGDTPPGRFGDPCVWRALRRLPGRAGTRTIMMPYSWRWSSLQVTGQPDFWHPTGWPPPRGLLDVGAENSVHPTRPGHPRESDAEAIPPQNPGL